MPEYLIFFNDEWVTEATDEGWQQRARDTRALVDEMKAAGVCIFAGGLDNDAPVFHAEPGGDEPLVTDGPYAETKEQMGGFDILDCADLDEAIEVASKHPIARYGMIELRPFWTP